VRLIDGDVRRLAAQVAGINDPEIRSVYLSFALGFSSLRGMALRPDSHGYIENELRAYCGSQWYLSAVLNENWVLFYIRWPAIRDGAFSADAFRARFSDAELTNAKDVKLRVPNLELASDILMFLAER
jgi:hypothetical protein